MSRLDEFCSELGWTHSGSVVDYTMQSLLRIMGPGCEYEITDDHYLHALQLNTYDIAKMKNFSGGESNRCFHKFLVRYHDYNEWRYENTTVTNLAVYLAYERPIYGFCTRLLQARDNKVPPSNPTITDQIATLQQSLRGALCIMSEKVSPCPTEGTPTIPTWLMSNGEANNASSASRANHYEARKSTTSSSSTSTKRPVTTPSTSPITQEPNETRPWADIARKAEEQAIGNKSYKYPTPDSALETYRTIGMLMIALLKQSNGSRNLYDYKALVFYPANDDIEYCIRNGTGGDLYSSKHNNVRFILARYDRSQLDNDKTVRHMCSYCEAGIENQCDRLKMMPNTVNAMLSKSRAVVAIKCARKFVWYELGYRYFQASWTNSIENPSSHGNEYSFKCGNIVEFP